MYVRIITIPTFTLNFKIVFTYRQKNVAGIFLMGGYTALEPGKKEAFSDAACKFKGPNVIHPFAFRTHAHSLGHQIVGYIVKPDGSWELIGTRSPQDAQVRGYCSL